MIGIMVTHGVAAITAKRLGMTGTFVLVVSLGIAATTHQGVRIVAPHDS